MIVWQKRITEKDLLVLPEYWNDTSSQGSAASVRRRPSAISSLIRCDRTCLSARFNVINHAATAGRMADVETPIAPPPAGTAAAAAAMTDSLKHLRVGEKPVVDSKPSAGARSRTGCIILPDDTCVQPVVTVVLASMLGCQVVVIVAFRLQHHN